MTRVMVIGNAGGGKSQLSRIVSNWHGLPYFSIDDMQWRPGWRATPNAEFFALHRAATSGERWIVDGFGNVEAIKARLAAYDTVIFVDLPFHIHLWWAFKRQVTSIFFGRIDGPKGCPMWRVTFRMFFMMWRIHRGVRPKLFEMIQARKSDVRLIHIKTPAALNAFARSPL